MTTDWWNLADFFFCAWGVMVFWEDRWTTDWWNFTDSFFCAWVVVVGVMVFRYASRG